MNIEFIPNKGIEPLYFGKSIKDILKKYELESYTFREKGSEYDNDLHMYTFKKLNSFTVFCEEDQCISSIICQQKCLYKGQNLIGLSDDQIVELFGKPDNTDSQQVDNPPELPQIIFYYENFGMDIWFKYGLTVSVTIYNGLE
ncbi:hypothetical protein [Algivirga pacifica]|uniref:Uncharacterized protein n=1 Tax=Algivirga pacifica TaxID=1162670 RepID=A0ABP9DDN1_9BACT